MEFEKKDERPTYLVPSIDQDGKEEMLEVVNEDFPTFVRIPADDKSKEDKLED